MRPATLRERTRGKPKDMETENLLITTVLESWKLVTKHGDDALLDLSDEQLQLQVAPRRNRIYYLLGHLAVVHDRAIPMFGK
jgi:hypothetical protein